jgi:hypothetical protein
MGGEGCSIEIDWQRSRAEQLPLELRSTARIEAPGVASPVLALPPAHHPTLPASAAQRAAEVQAWLGAWACLAEAQGCAATPRADLVGGSLVCGEAPTVALPVRHLGSPDQAQPLCGAAAR